MAFLLAVTVKVPVEVGTVLVAALTAFTAVFVAALAIFPLVMPIRCRVEELVFTSLLFSFETVQLWSYSTVQFFLYAGLESLNFARTLDRRKTSLPAT